MSRPVPLLLLCLAIGGQAVGAEQSARSSEQAAPRKGLTINGRAPTPAQLRHLEVLERASGLRLPDRGYWYDRTSGAFGFWGGPVGTFLPAGLDLGPSMPPNCSGGGTGVFFNGRELHPLDVMALRTFTVVFPGRYWVNSQGIGGLEGGPPSFNLVSLARQAQSRSSGGGGPGGGGPWGEARSGGGYVSGDGKSSVMFKDATGHVVMVGP